MTVYKNNKDKRTQSLTSLVTFLTPHINQLFSPRLNFDCVLANFPCMAQNLLLSPLE